MRDTTASRDFLGRETELATLERVVAGARRGVPAVVLVGGDAGIGKSTLVAEAARRTGARLVVGRCLPMGGEAIPLAPLAEVLRTVRRTSPDVLRASPRIALLEDWRTGTLTADVAAGGLFGPVLELLGSLAADDAALIAFEDLQWADTVSWDLFDFLARNVVDERVVLVGTYRSDEVGTHHRQRRRLGELMRLPPVHRIHLGGLGYDNVAARVEAMIGRPPAPALVDDVVARGQGNPFFTAELVTAHLNGEAIPAVLSDLITSDLAGLDDATRCVLGVIAAVGRDVAHDVLERVADLHGAQLDAALRAGIDAHLVVVDRDRYRFRHALIGEVVYAELLPSERTRLHRRIADVLTGQEPRVLSRADRAGELAFHLDRAGDRAGAFVALLAATDAAEAVAPAAALRHLERAFEIWEDAGEAAGAARRGDRLWQAAELASATGATARAVELAAEASAIGPPPRGVALGHERVGRYLWAAGRVAESAGEYQQAAELLAAGDRSGPAAAVHAGLAQADLMFCRHESAERRCREALDLIADPDDAPGAFAAASRVLGLLRSHAGDTEQAVELCRQAVAAAPTANEQAISTAYLVVALTDAGRYEEVVAVALEGANQGHVAGLDRHVGGTLAGGAAEGLIRLGRWAEATTVIARLRDVELVPVAALRLRRADAMLAARRGENERARELLADVEALALDPWHHGFVHDLAADVHLHAGDWNRAQDAAERGLRPGCTAHGRWTARLVMWNVTAAVEQTLDARARRHDIDVDAVIARLQAQVRSATPPPLGQDGAARPAESAANLAHAAAVLTRLTAPDPDTWAATAARWEQLHDPYLTAIARLHEAEAAASVGDLARAADALRRAHHLAVGLGTAGPLVARITALSQRTRLSLEPVTALVAPDAAFEHLGLTPREVEVLRLVTTGRTNRQIADALYLSDKTVSVHVSNILRKLGVSSRVDAAAIAQRLGAGAAPGAPS